MRHPDELPPATTGSLERDAIGTRSVCGMVTSMTGPRASRTSTWDTWHALTVTVKQRGGTAPS
jgi:hypothetical protein